MYSPGFTKYTNLPPSESDYTTLTFSDFVPLTLGYSDGTSVIPVLLERY